MKKIALVLIAGSFVLATQTFASSIDAQIDQAFQTFEDKGAFDSLSTTEMDSLHNLIKDQITDLNLKPENIDQAFLSGLISTGLNILKGLGGKIFGVLKGIGEKVLGTITKLVGEKGSAIVGAVINKVKGITADQVKEVGKRVAANVVEGAATSVIADVAASAVEQVTGVGLSKKDKADAVKEGEQAHEEATDA